MRVILLMLLIAIVPACAHPPVSCEQYCMSRGGSCQAVESGWSRYNTTTGHVEEHPTHFVCRYSW